LSLSELGDSLAAVNASLNATSAVALLAGFVLIHRRNVHGHRKAMVTALTASGLFLVLYVTRIALTGTHSFAGEGLARTVYFTILFSHMALAVFVFPFVLRLVYLARHRRFHEHAYLARRVFPIWAYVSLTGLLVYLLLYHVYGYS
jgi:putative membrane protein